MLEIDGSYGEGGGQILRTALSLSSVTGTPFRIVNIRRGRRKPGLMPQHLAAVRAAATISGADIAGAEPGSSMLAFSPKTVRGGDYEFHIGTAGAVTLVLQAVILPLLRAVEPSRLHLSGGTHVPFSPSADYLAEVFAPMVRQIGGEFRVDVNSYGFYPRGGGALSVRIIPAAEFRSLNLSSPGGLRRVSGCSGVCRLPMGIAERQRSAALALLEDGSYGEARIDLVDVPGPAAGTFLFLKAETESAVAGFTSLGARGKRAETVGMEAAAELSDHLFSGSALDPHLADQLVPFLSFANGESRFTTSRITRHLLTNLWVTSLFLPIRFEITGSEGEPGEVAIFPPCCR